ncbi:hypothetical protein [Parabacteroides timonensis]|uniref:hypothetical protein n=1 Tax=Parabacteroides timonensis TaxID=1871013 RepID=UPI00101D6FF2|nr:MULTISPECIES: hypothetical protein [Parabacteroides]
MRTIVLFLLVNLYCISIRSQEFTMFDESFSHGRIVLTPKDKIKPNYEGNREYYFSDAIGLVKELSIEFFRIFEPLEDEERMVMMQVLLTINFSKEFKTDYYEVQFPEKYRGFMIEKEKSIYKWVCTYNNIMKYKKYFDFDETFVGGIYSIGVRSFYRHGTDKLDRRIP